jgi:hypothetical protein
MNFYRKLTLQDLNEHSKKMEELLGLDIIEEIRICNLYLEKISSDPLHDKLNYSYEKITSIGKIRSDFRNKRSCSLQEAKIIIDDYYLFLKVIKDFNEGKEIYTEY